MNYLTALLAFSAIMIVLATLTTVVVEAIHGLTRRRARDFDEMLQKLYADAVAPRLKDLGHELGESTSQFAAEMRRNPAFKKEKIRFFTTAFNKLTTRQFVEQFAHTQAGKELQDKGDEVIKKTMSELAYEFERFGEAASDYFRRRAAVLSVLAAFVMALSLNVDAIGLFSSLASSKSVAEKVIAELDVETLTAAYEKSLEKADDKEAIDKAYADVRQQIRDSRTQLSGLGIPIGLDYFPYCSASADDAKDDRCSDGATILDRVATQDGLGWLLSVLIAGGLIGLGAPFWFKTYQFVAAFVPGIKLAGGTAARSKSSATVAAAADARPAGAADKAALVHDGGLTADDLAEAFVKSKRDKSGGS